MTEEVFERCSNSILNLFEEEGLSQLEAMYVLSMVMAATIKTVKGITEFKS